MAHLIRGLDWRCLVPHASADTGSVFDAYLHIASNTGARPKEVLSLTWPDVDIERLEITFRGVHTNNRKTRRIQISDKLLEQVNAYRSLDTLNGDAERIFPIQPKADSLRVSWSRLMAISKLDITPYILRHHFASTLARRGVQLTLIRDLMGHWDLTMTNKYLSVLTEDRFTAVNLL